MQSLKGLLLFLTILLISPLKADENKVFTFGVVPQQSASKLAKTWGPLMAKITKETGIALRFATAPNIPEFEKRLLAGEYDFAYMNPYHYEVFSKDPGYTAIAKARDKKITGILITRKDSDISDLAQLQDMTLAFPSPAAFAASILPRAEFKNNGISIKTRYVSSHDSVYRGVANGLFPAGGGITRTFNAVDPEIHDQLKILWTSNGYTPHAIASHPSVDAQVAKNVQSALVSIDATDEGKKMLEPLKIKGWQMAIDSDWDDVRALNIQTLDDLVK